MHNGGQNKSKDLIIAIKVTNRLKRVNNPILNASNGVIRLYIIIKFGTRFDFPTTIMITAKTVIPILYNRNWAADSGYVGPYGSFWTWGYYSIADPVLEDCIRLLVICSV